MKSISVIARRVLNSICVRYDITPKPPATIEWE